jgi:hypothetical protein
LKFVASFQGLRNLVFGKLPGDRLVKDEVTQNPV